MSRSPGIPRTIALGMIAVGIAGVLVGPVPQARSWPGAEPQAGTPKTGEQLTKEGDCFSCQAPDHVIV